MRVTETTTREELAIYVHSILYGEDSVPTHKRPVAIVAPMSVHFTTLVN